MRLRLRPNRLGRVLAVTLAAVAAVSAGFVYTAQSAFAAVAVNTNTTYEIVNVGSGKALDVWEWSTANGGEIRQWDRTQAVNQQFRFVSSGDGYYRILSLHSGKVVDVWEHSTAEGGQIRQHDDLNNPNQQFRLEGPDNNQVRVVNRNSNLALAVEGSSTAAGARILQSAATSPFTQFKLIPVGATTPPPGGTIKGPDPTPDYVRASTGGFATASENVSGQSGFGGGTIWYPTQAGQYGMVAISPGYVSSESAIRWLGPRLASFGFVVVTIATNSLYDQPASRGGQLLAALDHVTNRSSSTVRSRIDASRQAVMGHSMGGGGSLEAADRRPALKATVPMQPWNGDTSWGQVRVPSLIIGGQNDTIAPTGSHAVPFYNSLGGEKVYVELRGADHFATNSVNTTIGAFALIWLKRWVDGDTRYSPFICNADAGAAFPLSSYRTSCPI